MSKKKRSNKNKAPVQSEKSKPEVIKNENSEANSDIKLSNEPKEKENSIGSDKKASKILSSVKSDPTFGYYLRIAGTLTLICSFVALMLACVNAATKGKIEFIESEEKKAAVKEIFSEADDALLYEMPGEAGDVYIAACDRTLLGYCVSVTSQGYGGEIVMMVGISPDKTVRGVKIVSMSETAGVGSKTGSDSFLSNYTDKNGPFVVGENVDGIAGATVSSKAVTSGINSALELEVNLKKACDELNVLYEKKPSTESVETESTSQETSASDPDSATEPAVSSPVTEEKDTNIDPSMAGQNQSPNYYESDNSLTYTDNEGYYIEKETTDTEEAVSEPEV